MKFRYAIVNGEKTEAKKGLVGTCPITGTEMRAYCGEKNVHHWRHTSKQDYLHWWENETEWHRNWKDQFPKKWQEEVHFSESGEKNIADVKTENGWVLEFQHSIIDPDERRSRDEFYGPKLIWVVDGLKRSRDKDTFFTALNSGIDVLNDPRNPREDSSKSLMLIEPEKSLLISDWVNSSSLVFFDFHEDEKSDFWFMLPISSEKGALLMRFTKEQYVFMLNGELFDRIYDESIKPLCDKIMNPKQKEVKVLIKRRVKLNLVVSPPRRRQNRRF